MPIEELETVIAYESAAGDKVRALVFPENGPEEVFKTYLEFVKRRNLKQLGYPPRKDDRGTNYTRMLFDTHMAGSELPDDKAIKIRNDHLDSFIKYIIEKGIPVAENLPRRFSARAQAILEEMKAND